MIDRKKYCFTNIDTIWLRRFFASNNLYTLQLTLPHYSVISKYVLKYDFMFDYIVALDWSLQTHYSYGVVTHALISCRFYLCLVQEINTDHPHIAFTLTLIICHALPLLPGHLAITVEQWPMPEFPNGIKNDLSNCFPANFVARALA